MARLIDELLLLARSDAGTQTLERRPLDLADAVAEAATDLAALAERHAAALQLDLSPAPMRGDALRLRQLATILIDNAIRFGSPGGHAWVTVSGGDGAALLTIADDGPGIPSHHHELVFQRFWRGPDTEVEGSGLGLAIAAWIVSAQGGSIDVSERDGGGTVFKVRLPA